HPHRRHRCRPTHRSGSGQRRPGYLGTDMADRAFVFAPRRCLVTNDDGIGSDGLRVLAMVAVEAGFEVVVAAPMQECSGASASITAVEQDGRFVVESRAVAGLEGARAVLAVGGLPAFIALT